MFKSVNLKDIHYFIIGSGLFFIIAILLVFSLSQNKRILSGADFRAQYTGTVLLSQGVRDDFYNPDLMADWQRILLPWENSNKLFLPLLEPPFVPLLLLPLSFFPFEMAYMVWGVINTLLAIVLSLYIYKQLDHMYYVSRLLSSFLPYFSLPVWMTILQGQLSLVLVSVFFITWHLLRRKKDFWAGLVLSLLIIKPQLIILPIMFILWQKRKMTIVGCMIGVSSLIATSWLIIGTKGLQNYIKLLNYVATHHSFGVSLEWMHSLSGFLALLLGKQLFPEVIFIWVPIVLIFLVILFFIWRQRFPSREYGFDLHYVLLMQAVILLSPYAYMHDLSIVVFSSFFLFHAMGLKKKLQKIDLILMSVPLFQSLTFWLDRELAKTFSVHSSTIGLALGVVFLSFFSFKQKHFTRRKT